MCIVRYVNFIALIIVPKLDKEKKLDKSYQYDVFLFN